MRVDEGIGTLKRCFVEESHDTRSLLDGMMLNWERRWDSMDATSVSSTKLVMVAVRLWLDPVNVRGN